MLSLPENTTSADKVAANDDLLTEILIRLPVKSLLRFTSVSKHWHSLISNPHFAYLRNPDLHSVSGLFLQPTSSTYILRNGSTPTKFRNLQLEFIPLTNERFPTDDTHLGFPATFGNLSGVIILGSCCGLLLCKGFNEIGRKGYHVFNPTTKQFRTLPEPHLDGLVGLFLAFDPSKSPHYKVVSICSTRSVLSTQPYRSESYFQIEIYSSETGSWRASGGPFTIDVSYMVFRGGFYWNGAINWLNDSENSLYFNVQQERLGTIPMLPVPEGKQWYDRRLMHYGASREHLHFVGIYGPTTQFDVYEMKRDYSEWFVQYKVNLTSVASAFPKMSQTVENWYSSYSIVSLVRGESDEESYLVLHLAGKLIRYNLVADTFETIHDVSRHGDGSTWYDDDEDTEAFYGVSSYQYIESYSAV